ncbi:MAG: tRNA pseudouridine(55) synthase TruB, partial [Wenzhouxiangellaceae bacterium]
GLTSNAALTRAKRVLGIRKAGHTGALDPLATGLLPLCFGEATKVSAFLLDADKGYLAELELGAETASGDAEGEIIARSEVPVLSVEDIERVLDGFRGEIDQVPPMYSALKHQGRRLHELARAGIEVERKPRRVTIDELQLLRFDSPRMALRVRCSKGTYIRSLAMDIGQVLGCGAHLTALRRDRSGPFRLEDASTMERLEEMEVDAARALLLPADRALVALPEVHLDSPGTADIRQGRPVTTDAAQADPVRIYGDGRFLGIGRVDDHGLLRVRRLFH